MLARKGRDLPTHDILKDPKHFLEYLDKHSYWSESANIYKTSTSLYFSLFKKEKATAEERAFLRTFQKKHHSSVGATGGVSWSLSEVPLQVSSNQIDDRFTDVDAVR